MTQAWQIQDILDLEYFLNLDKNAGDGEDRRVYLEYSESRPPCKDRRDIFRYWLKRCREKAAANEKNVILPGNIYTEAVSAVRLTICTLALISGAGLAWSVLSYSGAMPVNVFTCLWVILAPQLILLFILGASSFVYRFKRKSRGEKGLYALITVILLKISKRILQFAAAKTSKDKHNKIQSTLGIAGQTRGIYGGLFYWQIFNTAQTAGVIFNIGIIAAMLLRITITDVAFGWQSTLYPDPQTVYSIVEIIASPWAWFAEPPLAHPTAAQIEGSRIILKQGIYQLATGDLVSWWPFLCLSVVFYGLMPRLLLLIMGNLRQRHYLKNLKFNHPECERLWHRMTAPQVRTESRPYTKSAGNTNYESLPEKPYSSILEKHELMPAVAIIPEELEIEGQSLQEELQNRLGLGPVTLIRASGDPEKDAEKLSRQQSENKSAHRRLVFIQESWQPPIKESLSWIKHLKHAAGPDAAAMICLVGMNEEFTGPVPQAEQIIWEQAINSMGDPYIRVETLGQQKRDKQ